MSHAVRVFRLRNLESEIESKLEDLQSSQELRILPLATPQRPGSPILRCRQPSSSSAIPAPWSSRTDIQHAAMRLLRGRRQSSFLQLRIKKSSLTTFGGFASRHPHIYRNNLHRRLSVSPDCLVESPALERVVNRNSQTLKSSSFLVATMRSWIRAVAAIMPSSKR